MVSAREAEPNPYSGVVLNEYEQTVEKEKREAEADSAGNTYGGVFLNKYAESAEKTRREAEGKLD